jgi:hypothetical protein
MNWWLQNDECCIQRTPAKPHEEFGQAMVGRSLTGGVVSASLRWRIRRSDLARWLQESASNSFVSVDIPDRNTERVLQPFPRVSSIPNRMHLSYVNGRMRKLSDFQQRYITQVPAASRVLFGTATPAIV